MNICFLDPKNAQPYPSLHLAACCYLVGSILDKKRGCRDCPDARLKLTKVVICLNDLIGFFLDLR